MAQVKRTVPQPTLVDLAKPSEIPEILKPLPPGPLRVTQVMATGNLELAVIYKRCYSIAPNRDCRVADEQIPLIEEAQPHDEMVPGAEPSYKALTEVIGFKTGTDVVVQAAARPPKPVTTMTVGIRIGQHRHRVSVIGRRFCDYSNGKLVFTPPEPFEEMPLRHENAYGGRDRPFEAAFLKEVEQSARPKDLRKSRDVLTALFGTNNHLMYPRNRFGKGYVIQDRREFIEGRELPNLERPDDLLTTDRLVVGNALRWALQPLPAGFDYLDPLTFPRCALLGVPPPISDLEWDRIQEVTQGLLPKDFCRGSVSASSPEEFIKLLHPLGSRCASLGLWLPFLRGDEELVLEGMDAVVPTLRLMLPREKPEFTVPGHTPSDKPLDPELHLVFLDVPKKRLNLIWVGRTPLPRPLVVGEDRQLAPMVQVRMRRI
jgi:hypothetical protein